MEPSASPRLVILGILPPSLRQHVTRADGTGASPSLRTRLEGVSFSHQSGFPQCDTVRDGHPPPSIVVDDVVQQRCWRARLRSGDAAEAGSPSETRLTRTRPSASPSAEAEEVLSVPPQYALHIDEASWTEEESGVVVPAAPLVPQGLAAASSPSSSSPTEPMTAAMGPPPPSQTAARTAATSTTTPLTTATSAAMPPPANRPVRSPTSARPASSATAVSTPSAPASRPAALLADSAPSAASLLAARSPHSELVNLLIHALARSTLTLATATTALTQTPNHTLKKAYTAADVQYVLETALCTPTDPAARGARTYTLRPELYVTRVEVDDFPRGTPQHDVAERLFRLLDPTDPAQRAKRDKLAYLVDRDLVLAAHDAQREREANAETVGNGADREAEKEDADIAVEVEAATAIAAASVHGRKRAREAERGDVDHPTPAPLFTSLKQLDVDWEAGDLRLLLPDSALESLRATCASLRDQLTALGLGEIGGTEASAAEVAMAPAAKAAPLKKSHKKKKAVAEEAPVESSPLLESSKALAPWLRAVPIQTPATHDAARVLYGTLTRHVTALSAILSAYEAQRTRLDHWLSTHDRMALYSTELWSAMTAYGQAQAARLAVVRPLHETMATMQFLVYRDLRDYEDLCRFGVPFPIAPRVGVTD